MLNPNLFQTSSPAQSRWSVCGKLAARQALSCRPRTAGVLRMTQGRLWLTLDGPHHGPANAWGDHVLCAGQSMTLGAGQRWVVETWPVADGMASQFEWLPAPTVCGALASRVQKRFEARLQDAGRSLQGFKYLLGL
jgi:hypothetical protein